MANWFQKMFIGSVLAGSLSVPPVHAENAAQDAKTNLTEAPAPTIKNHSEIRIFKKVNVIDMETPLPGSWMGGGHNQEEKASYDHAHKRIVCQTYFISDEVAYARTPTTAPRMPRADFKTALNEFNQMLKAVKYKGSLPETLEDVQNVLASAGKNLGKKDAQNVSRTASSTGLEAAICFKRSIENINNENTSRHIIVHEMEHGETAKIGEKAFLPETLLSPQDYLLFNMADELNSHFKEGALAGKSQQKVVDEFRSIKEACYLERYSGDIARNNSFWHSETYRHAYAQNLDLKSSQQIVDSKPIVFDAETFSVTVDNIQYPVSKCVDETNQTWCYTVMEGDGRQQLPEGTVVTTPGGKKFAANVLYDQNGKQVKDKDGNTVGAVGYFNENDGWSIRLSGSRQTAEDNFSSANLEKLMTEKFGEKISRQSIPRPDRSRTRTLPADRLLSEFVRRLRRGKPFPRICRRMQGLAADRRFCPHRQPIPRGTKRQHGRSCRHHRRLRQTGHHQQSFRLHTNGVVGKRRQQGSQRNEEPHR